jgi:hypothetical protein
MPVSVALDRAKCQASRKAFAIYQRRVLCRPDSAQSSFGSRPADPKMSGEVDWGEMVASVIVAWVWMLVA